MSAIHDPINLTGIGGILLDDNDEFDINKLEKSLTSGFSIDETSTEVPDFTKEFDDIDEIISNRGKDDNRRTFDQIDESDSESSAYEQEHRYPPMEPLVSSSTHHTWSARNPEDRQLARITNEERKQSHINKVFNEIDDQDTKDDEFIQAEEEEDEMARILEQIDLLYTNLQSEGVNLDRIPEVTTETSKKEARSVLKILQIKNDRARYCDMFEATILTGAYGLESLFNGEREWFGAKIDLVGWPETVKMKLRRMRYDTSSFVSGVMKEYSFGHGWRIIMELLPSLFLYSRNRRKQSNDTLSDDPEFKNTLQSLAYDT